MVSSSINIAILDDYQNVAFDIADWSGVQSRANVVSFHDHLKDGPSLVERLSGFDALCVMRERTPITETLLDRLPKLKLIVSTGEVNAAIDAAAAQRRGVRVAYTSYSSTPTIELTWALILASLRNIAVEAASLKQGGWQLTVGSDLSGKTIGIIGLGNVGRGVAKVATAFGMRVIAWSKHLSVETAEQHGAILVSKEELLRNADIVTLHTVLSRRTTGMIGKTELELMKPSAYLINTSRGRLVDEDALLSALRTKRIAGAAIDVYDSEPPPPDHPYRRVASLLATPHIGYVTSGLYRRFYADAVRHFLTWLDDFYINGS